MCWKTLAKRSTAPLFERILRLWNCDWFGGVGIGVVLQKGGNWRSICGWAGVGSRPSVDVKGRLGFIFIAPSHSGTTMGSSTASSRRWRKEEMEEIGRNGTTKYSTKYSTKYVVQSMPCYSGSAPDALPHKRDIIDGHFLQRQR